jgi:uncharacterized repeat protein (TIGR03803 family)
MHSKKFPIVAVASLFVLFAASLMAPSVLAADKLKVLYTFTGGSDGGWPYGGLIFDHAGNLYSTALGGGIPTYGYGTAFSLTPNQNGTWTETVLHDFQEPQYIDTDGLNPHAGLISDSAGNMYGTTYYGGAPYDAGTVFELSPDGNGQFTETLLHAFDGKHGGYSQASLIFDSVGNLYGTTYGVEGHCGTVFKLSPGPDGQWTETVLHDFGKPSPKPNGGCGLAGNLVFDSAGNLYGTTWNGGANINFGCVFKLTPQPNGAWRETLIHSFGVTGGAVPYSGLIIDAKGNLYGTNFGGDNESCEFGCGNVFKLTPGAHGKWTETVLHSFDFFDGAGPQASLILDSAGNLYGTTAWGGNSSCAGGCGLIFKLVPGAKGQWTETVVHYFDGLDGWGPISNLIFDSAGNLYGTALAGGPNLCCGVAFELTP